MFEVAKLLIKIIAELDCSIFFKSVGKESKLNYNRRKIARF
jgi:hypothetical protein